MMCKDMIIYIMIYIDITVLTLANIRHSHGICPTTQLSWLSLEWTDVYTSSGGRKNWCYVHNQCMYIFTISSLLPHPPKWWRKSWYYVHNQCMYVGPQKCTGPVLELGPHFRPVLELGRRQPRCGTVPQRGAPCWNWDQKWDCDISRAGTGCPVLELDAPCWN